MNRKNPDPNHAVLKFDGIHDTEIIIADIKNTIDRTAHTIINESLKRDHYDLLDNEYNNMIHKLIKS